MIRAVGLCLICASQVAADTFCADLTDPAQPVLRLPDGTEGTCAVSLNLSGEQADTCRWPFAYRAPNAMAAFDALLEATADCLQSEPVEDQGVNHPDSYDLRTFESDGTQIAISIKDKGALQQTYVFLRRAPRP
ncbi:MAG: hypothetical protein AAFY39_03230 [Pseudomonadota bacterium]